MREALPRWPATDEPSEALTRAALDALPDGCQVVGFDWRYLYVNDACARQARRGRAELVGRTMHDCFPGIGATELFADLERCMRDRVPIVRENVFTYPGGAHAAFELRIVPVPQGICVFSMDATEQHVRDVTELRAAQQELEQANRDLESFAYSVAHDLRAPLRAIDGFSQALLEDHAWRLDASGLRYLNLVRAGAQRMATLIDDLLALSKVSRDELKRCEIDVTKTAAAIIERWVAQEPGRRVAVVVEPALRADADPRLLELVLENLLGNAWKFTSRRSCARIEVGYEMWGGEPVLFVRDDGAGFDPAYQHKLFGVFARLHTEAEFPGTGVGLATVQRIVHRHGGRVWAEGAPDAGATFRFTLGAEAIHAGGGAS